MNLTAFESPRRAAFAKNCSNLVLAKITNTSVKTEFSLFHDPFGEKVESRLSRRGRIARF